MTLQQQLQRFAANSVKYYQRQYDRELLVNFLTGMFSTFDQSFSSPDFRQRCEPENPGPVHTVMVPLSCDDLGLIREGLGDYIAACPDDERDEVTEEVTRLEGRLITLGKEAGWYPIVETPAPRAE